MRVLIADDSVVSRHLLEATLKKWSYEVVVVCDGAEAWELLQQPDAPAIAILDWMMPGLSGPEVCDLVRKENREPYTYILLLTSRSLKEDLIAGMEAGADDYITKPFDQHELKVRLRAGTRIVDLQAELLAAREALREQATHDALTKLWNRAYILETLHRELNRADREHCPVGLAMVDLDHFKAINDTYGHQAGDAVLREASHRMQTSIRPYDTIGRYGGEEFLVILPGCNHQRSESQAERMRSVLEKEPILVDGHSVSLTASIGVTCVSGGVHVSSESLVRVADEALYEAKRQGRNRVCLMEHSTISR